MNLYDSRILIVDDEKALSRMVEGVLQKEGFFRIYTAADCKSAELLTAENELQMILLDVMLPDGDGFSLYKVTAKEYTLLRKLSENRGRILSMNVLCDTLWPDGSYGYENSLMVHIRRLREKIEENPSKPEHILTVRGLGYKLI